jgi:hypothetical protein
MSKFKELAKGEIGENKNIVVSIRDDGNISIAQQVVAPVNGKPINIFIKNAIEVDEAGLNSIINTLVQACEKLKEK